MVDRGPDVIEVESLRGREVTKSFFWNTVTSMICDLLLNRRMVTWNLFVLYKKKMFKSFNDDVIHTSVLQ